MTSHTGADQPFFLEGDTTGLLLIHGFMGQPAELRPLGDHLARAGYTVSGPLLARHGGAPDVLQGIRWQEWYISVEQAYHELRLRCDRVVAIGFSLGGLLALHLAAQQPLDGMITLAAALQLAGGWPLRVLPVARYVIPWFYPMRGNDFRDPQLRADLTQKVGEINWEDPDVIARLQRSIRIPTGAIHELVRIGQHVRAELGQITTPALVLQGRRDQVVLPQSAQVIFERLASHDKEIKWFDRSNHQLPNDVEQEAVWRTIDRWLDRRVHIDRAVVQEDR